MKFSASIGMSHRTIEAQLRFVKHELETLPYLGLGQLRQASTVEEATKVFQDKYEYNEDLLYLYLRELLIQIVLLGKVS